MLLFLLYIFIIALWALSYVPQWGVGKSAIVALCRGLWMLPLLLTFLPQKISEPLPHSVLKKPVHIFLDDSESMGAMRRQSPLAKSLDLIERTEKLCQRSSCEVHLRKLSEESPMTKKGYSPLSDALSSWFAKVGEELWIVLSDGGDMSPAEAWPSHFKDMASQNEDTYGVLLGIREKEEESLWIQDLKVPPVAFEGSTSSLDILLHRERKFLEDENVQVQVWLEDQILISENVFIPKGQDSIWTSHTIPALARGHHELRVKVLAPVGEKVLWNKERFASIEVMSNTFGVLHLLGNPSWDGRFLRRYLKSEPKYDLISFFILRDAWDLQAVDEREMSLIPFPVSRLFGEELRKFRVIIFQNFQFLQFLAPQYQRNLVNFVKEGGGLLFLGGPRALQSQDLQNTPLREILPFELKKNLKSRSFKNSSIGADKLGPWYDKDLEFKIEFAESSAEKLALTTVYDQWLLEADSFEKFGFLKGLHRTENVTLKRDTTPLLMAKLSNGDELPLSLASYPGKGRAIWVFSDDFWRLALDPEERISRSVYNHVMESAFSWLMRHDFRKPLSINQFKIRSLESSQSFHWSVELQGPALKFFDPHGSWVFRICGENVDLYKASIRKQGWNRVHVSGTGKLVKGKGKTCKLEIQGEHPSFGSLFESRTAPIPKLMKDQEVGGSAMKMRELSELTNAKLFFVEDTEEILQFLEAWIGEQTGDRSFLGGKRYRILLDPYWALERWWFLLLICFLPLEVVFRRWFRKRI